MMTLGVAAAATAVTTKIASAQAISFTPSPIYPDPAIQVLDPSFAKYRVASASLEQVATGARWNVLAQQIAMCQLDDDPAPAQRLSMDMWDGYRAAKERVINGMAERRVSNPVVLTGDFHNNVAGELKANFDDPASPTVGVEFIGTSISSGGNGSERPANWATYMAANPHLKFYNGRRGYLTVELGEDAARADYLTLPTITTPGAPITTAASFTTEAGSPGLEPA